MKKADSMTPFKMSLGPIITSQACLTQCKSTHSVKNSLNDEISEMLGGAVQLVLQTIVSVLGTGIPSVVQQPRKSEGFGRLFS